MQIKTKWAVLSGLVYGLLQGAVLMALGGTAFSLLDGSLPKSILIPAIIPLIVGIIIFVKDESPMVKRMTNSVSFFLLGAFGIWIDLLIYISIFGI